MREIPLTRGFVTLVDDDDYEELAKHRWCCLWVKRPYAVRNGAIYLHRWLLDAPKNKVVYHLNGNSLDNRRENLLMCTHHEIPHAHRPVSTDHAVFQQQLREHHDDLLKLTDAMRLERQRQELTMVELAAILSIDISYISRMESHQRTPGANLARRIEHWLSNSRQNP